MRDKCEFCKKNGKEWSGKVLAKERLATEEVREEYSSAPDFA